MIDGCGIENGCTVPICVPEIFRSRESLTEYESHRLAVQQIALRILCGFETGSLSHVATANGLSKATLSAACHSIARRIGLSWSLKSDSACVAFSESARRRWAERKRPPGTNPAASQKNEGHAKQPR